MNEKRIEVKRPDWKTFFLIDAIWWSKRSPDAQTQCGSVIVASDNTPISAGYNGYIRAKNTDQLPNIRPYKYPFFIHSELNAILNACRNGKSVLGATIYVSGKPCTGCLQYIFHSGIKHIVYTDYSLPHMVNSDDEEYIEVLRMLLHEDFKMTFIPKEQLEGYLKWDENKSVTINLS